MTAQAGETRLSLRSVRRDPASAFFFDAAARGRVALLRCATCGWYLEPTSWTCSRCGGTTLTPVDASGAGSVITWAVDRIAERSGGAPVVVAIVELDEGPWLHTRLAGVELQGVHQALRVAARFVRSGGDADPGEWVPVFVPEQGVPT